MVPNTEMGNALTLLLLLTSDVVNDYRPIGYYRMSCKVVAHKPDLKMLIIWGKATLLRKTAILDMIGSY